jgi:hypothetical protein
VQTLIQPALQRENGTYVGTDSSGMVVFDQNGNIKWSVPDFQPIMVTSDNGVVAQSWDGMTNIIFDSTGNAISQLASLPTTSWTGQLYLSSMGEINSVDLAPLRLGSSFAATLGGNLSANGTAVGVVETMEGKKPAYKLKYKGPVCTLGIDAPPLAMTDAARFIQYEDLRKALVASGKLTSDNCKQIFTNQSDPNGYFYHLTEAVNQQRPFDGPQSTISILNAGTISADYLQNNPDKVWLLSTTPVCSVFVPYRNTKGKVMQPSSVILAEAQGVNPPATDIYLNTASSDLLRDWLAQSTILHEALHNWTGYDDDQLRNLISEPEERRTGTITTDINKWLEEKGCANGP